MSYYVYVMASKPNGMLYIDVTSNLAKRVEDHLLSKISGFSTEYNVKILVYYEEFLSYVDAVKRAELFKLSSSRNWLIGTIEEVNPFWNDLYEKIAAVEYA